MLLADDDGEDDDDGDDDDMDIIWNAVVEVKRVDDSNATILNKEMREILKFIFMWAFGSKVLIWEELVSSQVKQIAGMIILFYWYNTRNNALCDTLLRVYYTTPTYI